PEQRHAVALAQLERLPADVQRLTHPAGPDHGIGALPEAVEGIAPGVGLAASAVELLQERAAQVDALDGQVARLLLQRGEAEAAVRGGAAEWVDVAARMAWRV